MVSIPTILYSGLITILGLILGAVLIRRKTISETEKNKAETLKIIEDTYGGLVETLNADRAHLQRQIEENKKKLREHEIANEDCEFEHSITRMQLTKALKRLDMMHWIKSTVFVCDDSEIVTKVFTQRFKTVPVVYFKAFTDADECLKQARIERPEILVLDYILSGGKTAEDIIKEIGYEPEIFIMSATKEYEVKFKDTDIRFFYKDQHYIRNITKAILEHLIYKNQ